MSQAIPDKVDYLIVGAGAAGLNLSIALAQDEFFHDKSILVIDKSDKTANDRFWSFWEKGTGKYDEIITTKYPNGLFIGPDGRELQFALGEYTYKTLESGKFNAYAKRVIDSSPNIEIIQAVVTDITLENERVRTETSEGVFYSSHVFDSRIGPGFGSSNAVKIWQHFKGWTIQTTKDVFDPETFTMMDFSVAKPGHTSFMYVLPFARDKALVEYTFFDHEPLKPEEYDESLESYIGDKLKLSSTDYQILDEEVGNIPMTDYPFHKESENRITKIGTAGSWVKGSTGYSFKNAMRNADVILENLKANHPVTRGLISQKHRFYDMVLLKVLDMYNERGGSIFQQMFTRNPISRILNFLGEDTTFMDELKVMASLSRSEFVNAALSKLFRR